METQESHQPPPEKKVKSKGKGRRSAEAFTFAGGLAAILFPIYGFYLGFVQNSHLKEYEESYVLV